MSLDISFKDVQEAAARIKPYVHETPMAYSHLGKQVGELGCDLWLKHEVRHITGSFKERGASNALQALDAPQRQRGVIAASAGNHALALAYHGDVLNIPVTVVMPMSAPQLKVNRCKEFGARVIQAGEHLLEAKEVADKISESEGLRYINGYNDFEIIAGAGTCGLEMLEKIPDLDMIVVPVGGGGLIAGVALAAKAIKPSIRVVGVEAKRVASMQPALDAGAPVNSQMKPSLADGLAVSTVGQRAYEVVAECVDEIVMVDEHDVAIAILRAVEVEKTVCEGAGAAGVAAILANKIDGLKGKKVATILCGGNIDTPMLGRILQRGMAADGRLMRLSAHISDRPGGLAEFAALVADVGASVVDITHDRVFGGDEVSNVSVLCTLQTRGKAHVQEVLARFDQAGIGYTRHLLLK